MMYVFSEGRYMVWKHIFEELKEVVCSKIRLVILIKKDKLRGFRKVVEHLWKRNPKKRNFMYGQAK